MVAPMPARLVRRGTPSAPAKPAHGPSSIAVTPPFSHYPRKRIRRRAASLPPCSIDPSAVLIAPGAQMLVARDLIRDHATPLVLPLVIWPARLVPMSRWDESMAGEAVGHRPWSRLRSHRLMRTNRNRHACPSGIFASTKRGTTHADPHAQVIFHAAVRAYSARATRLRPESTAIRPCVRRRPHSHLITRISHSASATVRKRILIQGAHHDTA